MYRWFSLSFSLCVIVSIGRNKRAFDTIVVCTVHILGTGSLCSLGTAFFLFQFLLLPLFAPKSFYRLAGDK